VKRRAVFIRWRDANDHDPGEWTLLPKRPGAEITAVGILVAKSEHYYTLCGSFDDNSETLYREVFTIPRSGIIEEYELDRK